MRKLKTDFIVNVPKILEGMYEKLESLPSMSINDFNPDTTLMISIDLNNGFAKEGNLSSPRVFQLIEGTTKLFKKAKEMGIKTVAYTDCHCNDSKELASYIPHCLDSSDESLVVEELKPYLDEIIKKNSTNGFLAKNIADTKYTHYIITGDCTDICISDFARTLNCYLNELNFNGEVLVVLDLIDTYDTPEHDADLLNIVYTTGMISNGIKVIRNIIL